MKTFQKTNPMAVKRWKMRKSAVKVTDPEKDLQAWSEQLIAMYDHVTMFRLPDTLLQAVYATDRVSIQDKKFISDYIKGFPDLVLFRPDLGEYKAIEIKTEKGKLSNHQRRWKEKLNTVVTHGWKATEKEIMEIVNRERKEI